MMIRQILASSALALIAAGGIATTASAVPQSLSAAPSAVQAGGCNTPDVSASRVAAALYCPGPIAGASEFKIRIFCNTGSADGPWRRIGGGLASAAGCPSNGTINRIEAIVR